MSTIQEIESPTRLRARRSESFAAIEDAWRNLMSRDQVATFFSRPEWLAPWWRHHAQGRELLLVVVYDGAQVVGIAPLMKGRRFGVSVIQLIGTGLSDYGDFVVDDMRNSRAAIVWELFDYLRKCHRNAIVDLQQIREDSPTVRIFETWLTAQRLPSVEYCQAECVYQQLPPSLTQYDDSLGRVSRQQERRKVRQLAKAGEVQFADVSINDHAWPELRDEIVQITRKRSEEMGYTSHWDGQLGEWLDDVLATTAADGSHWICGIRVDGRLVAYALLFRGRSVFYGYLHGFDSQWGKQSPQILLRHYCHRQAITQNIGILDDLRGREQYKEKRSAGTVRNYRMQFPVSKIGPISLIFAGWRLVTYAGIHARRSPRLRNIWDKFQKGIKTRIRGKGTIGDR